MAKKIRDFAAGFFDDDFGSGDIAIFVGGAGENNEIKIATSDEGAGMSDTTDADEISLLAELFDGVIKIIGGARPHVVMSDATLIAKFDIANMDLAAVFVGAAIFRSVIKGIREGVVNDAD